MKLNLNIIEDSSVQMNESDLNSAISFLRDKLPHGNVKRIVLINPPDGDLTMFRLSVAKRGRYNNNPPYGLGVLATVARAIGIEVKICNLNHDILKSTKNSKEDFDFDSTWKQEVDKLMKEFNPDIVGITCLFTMTHESFKKVVNHVSSFGVPIIAGGVHVTNDVDAVIKDVPAIDVVVLREGEIALRSLLLRLNDPNSTAVMGQIVFNQKKILKFLNDVRPGVDDFDVHPAMDLMQVSELSDAGCVGAYHYLKPLNTKISTVLFNRGCRGKCTFCCVSTFNGRGVRQRSVVSVVDEIERLRDDYGITHITWLDDDLLANQVMCMSLFEEISKRNLGVTWDASNGLIAAFCTDEIIHAAADSGCIGLVIGVESGNPEILRQIKKPGTVENFRKAAEVIRRYPQIYANVFLMIGFPNETISQIQDTINLAFELDLDWYKINTLQPLPNTPIYDSMLGNGILEQTSITKIHFDKQGGFGKVEDIESNKEVIRDTVEKIFLSKDASYVPNASELTDIWLYMVYHLNFERLQKLNCEQKARQHYLHLNHISTKVMPDHAFALYYMGVIDSILNRNISENTVSRLTTQLSESKYWVNRFFEVGICNSIHPIWEKDLAHILHHVNT